MILTSSMRFDGYFCGMNLDLHGFDFVLDIAHQLDFEVLQVALFGGFLSSQAKLNKIKVMLLTY